MGSLDDLSEDADKDYGDECWICGEEIEKIEEKRIVAVAYMKKRPVHDSCYMEQGENT